MIVWDFTHRKLFRRYTGHSQSIYCVRITSDNNFAISGSGDGTIRIWNIKGNSKGEILNHEGRINALFLSADDKWLLSCAGNKVKVWDFLNRKLKYELLHNAQVFSCKITEDYKLIYTGDNLNKLWVWDFETSKLKWVFGGNIESTELIDVTKDLKWIIVGEAGIVRIWNAKTLKQKAVLREITQIEDWLEIDLSKFRSFLK